MSLGTFLRSLTSPASPARQRQVRDAGQVIAACRTLLSTRGEASGVRRAADVLNAYRSLEPAALHDFFERLASEFSPDSAEIERAADAYKTESSQANLVRLQAAVEPPRQELFRRLNLAPGGTALLVQMRAQLLEHLNDHPQWTVIATDLAHLFRSWFNRGFLVLQRIDWRTPAIVLERLIQYEAVHQIQDWRDLHRRLEADRRCYGFFSPALPDDPLIFIEIALTRGMPAMVQPLLDPDTAISDPAKADHAVFYSITNCQKGLRGVSLGALLIKQVAEDLGRDLRWLRTSATLSPVPGFSKWLAGGEFPAGKRVSPELATLIDRLKQGEAPDVSNRALQTEITRLCAYYLLQAKRGAAPLDSVARFHLANGARLERLNWMGDTSATGLGSSLGFTVNYVYRLGEVEDNHEAYVKEHRVVASRALQQLANQAFSPPGGKRTPGASRE